MRVFVTGATGFIGSSIVKELVGAGHQVVGLARSEKSGKALTAMGARAVVGSIEDLDCLRRGAATANAAIHLAYFHQITHMKLSTRLGVMLGNPSGIFFRFSKAALEAEINAIETLGKSLVGRERVLISVLPTMALRPGHLATEEDAPDPKAVGGSRGPAEKAALALASKDIRASVVRLAPVVHDSEKQGLATMISEPIKKSGVAAYVGKGLNRWSGVHVLDAARLFRMVMEEGATGARYHAVAEEGVPFCDIAEALGRRLNVPIASKSSQEAAKVFGWLSSFVETDNPVSSKLTQERLGWHPAQRGLIANILGK